MTPGSDEWFREESEKAAGPESPLWAPVFEKALRRVWDAACEECEIGCFDAPVDAARCRVLNLPEQAWEEAQDQCSAICRAKKVKP